MIIETAIYQCRDCESSNLVRNGRTKTGKQKYHCQECGAYGTVNPTVKYPAERKAEILKAYHERSSLRGLEQTFGVARQTVAAWLRQEDSQLPDLPPLDPAQPDDVLELDELWSFVGSKKTNDGSG